MKVVIAIDSFKGSLSSLQAGTAAATGIYRVDPKVETVVRPLADGGEGTVQALTEGLGGRLVSVSVTGPAGKQVICPYGIIDRTQTAIIEMSGAAGITQVHGDEKNPLYATTYGVGEVICDAIRNGCHRFIIGIGGSATNDGGIGMLQALVFGPQKGADAVMIKRMDTSLASYAALCRKTFPNVDAEFPGTGAAGGLGFAFQTFLSASLEPGIQIILDETRLRDDVRDADLVITGEGQLDGQTVMGKAPIGVAKLSKEYGKPVLAFSGCVTKDASACNAAGIDAFFPIMRSVVSLEEAMDVKNAAENMADTVEQAFRLFLLQ